MHSDGNIIFCLLFIQHRYDDIVLWYHDQCLQFEEYCSFIPSIGKSVEGRDMPAVHIGYKSRVPEFKIYFQCQIHASKKFKSSI